MILHPEFVIITPVKTGTEALESCFVRRGRVAQRVMPKHNPVGVDFGERRRYSVVRDPYDRLASGYNMLHKGRGHMNPDRSLISCAVNKSFGEWLQLLLKLRARGKGHDWRVTQFEYMAELKPDFIGRTEALEHFAYSVAIEHGLDVPTLTRVNVTRKPVAQWTPELYALVRDFVIEDCEAYGYKIRY